MLALIYFKNKTGIVATIKIVQKSSVALLQKFKYNDNEAWKWLF